MEFIERES